MQIPTFSRSFSWGASLNRFINMKVDERAYLNKMLIMWWMHLPFKQSTTIQGIQDQLNVIKCNLDIGLYSKVDKQVCQIIVQYLGPIPFWCWSSMRPHLMRTLPMVLPFIPFRLNVQSGMGNFVFTPQISWLKLLKISSRSPCRSFLKDREWKCWRSS